MTVKKANDEYRDEQRKNRPSRCERQSEECQRTFWIAELFVPGHIWEAINLCEQIKNFGIAWPAELSANHLRGTDAWGI